MTIKSVICDIDGVLLHDNTAIKGANDFLARIQDAGMPLVILTNYPSQTAQDLTNRFITAGLDVPESAFYTSAMATADFLRRQDGKKAYVIGEGALVHELYKAGFTITDINPDFVIVGETRSYNWDMMHKAAYLLPMVHVLLPLTRTATATASPQPVVLCAHLLKKYQAANRFMSVSQVHGSSVRR